MKSLLRQRLRRAVLVTLKSGEAFSGVLFDADRECVILRNAEAAGMGQRGANLPVDGEVVLLRADIAYIQLP